MFQPRLRTIANFAVTYRCDSRCATCDVWKRGEGDELTLDEVAEFFAVNASALGGVGSIQLTGGEPTLRGDLPEIVGAIRRSLPGCFVWVPTNGLDPDRVLRVLKGCAAKGGPLGISVSIDGVGGTHDAQRGVEGAYLNTVRTLSELSKLRESHPMELSVGMTVTAANVGQAEQVAMVASRYGADFSLRLAHGSALYYGERRGSEVDPAALDRALRTAASLSVRRRGLPASLRTLAYLEGVRSRRRRRCTAGKESVFIDPLGNVYPCIFVPTKMGNIREDGITSILNSDEAHAAREEVAHGECSGCWVECEAFRDISAADALLAGARFVLALPPLSRSA